ncbi:hypothetical protein BDW22DRAFT_1482890 [Trametopsis cervina]|nr:hypothetical protein BDW22DRAFT_1482890 [Trametopsis cervina]
MGFSQTPPIPYNHSISWQKRKWQPNDPFYAKQSLPLALQVSTQRHILLSRNFDTSDCRMSSSSTVTATSTSSAVPSATSSHCVDGFFRAESCTVRKVQLALAIISISCFALALIAHLLGAFSACCGKKDKKPKKNQDEEQDIEQQPLSQYDTGKSYDTAKENLVPPSGRPGASAYPDPFADPFHIAPQPDSPRNPGFPTAFAAPPRAHFVQPEYPKEFEAEEYAEEQSLMRGTRPLQLGQRERTGFREF